MSLQDHPFEPTAEDDARFFGYIAKQPNGCWTWTAARNRGGYGQFGFKGRNVIASRWSYRRFRGELTGIVCHTCDNRACVNPDHLYVGTHMDNRRDAVERGRIAYGSRHGLARLTEEEAWAIRQSKEPRSVLALRFGICRAQVSKVRSGRQWARLTEPTREA